MTYQDHVQALEHFVNQTTLQVVVEALEHICRAKERAMAPMSVEMSQSWGRAAKQLEIVTHVLRV